jgi:hypothetical protein
MSGTYRVAMVSTWHVDFVHSQSTIASRSQVQNARPDAKIAASRLAQASAEPYQVLFLTIANIWPNVGTFASGLLCGHHDSGHPSM